MTNHDSSRWSFCAALLLIAAGALLGQTGSGTIQGTVTDPTGAVIPGASVTATNIATGVQTARVTTAAGLYVLSPLPPGQYNVQVAAPGFQTLTNERITVDARVVAATNRDVKAMIAEGRFREDLFYRLGVITIHVPALRERGDDLRLLAEYFLEFYGRQHKRKLKGFTQAALRAIMAHPWPGNVRELENRVQRAVILSQDAYLRPEDLELQSAGGTAEPLPTLQRARDEAERRLLVDALTRNAGNVTRAARDIDVSRPTLHDLLRKHALDASRFRRPGLLEVEEEDGTAG